MTRRIGNAALLVALLALPAATLAGCASTRTTVHQIDDAAITANVKTHFAEDPLVKAHEIDVDTIDGTVTLTGRVDSSEVRHEANRIARESMGVVAVRDNLTVGSDPTIGQKVDDVGITTRIKAKMIEDPVVKARDIDVDTIAGVVTLTGKVQSAAERSRAQQIAESMQGVRSVRNLLEVVG